MIAGESKNKILEVDKHIIATSAGILSDARVLMDQAQVLAQQNRITYDSPIEPLSVIRMIADKKQQFTQYGGARPFAVAILLGGVNKGKTHLYTTDLVGNFSAYKANAIGENDEKIREILRKDYKEDMTIDQGISFTLKIFKDILGKNFELNRFDVAYVKMGGKNVERLYGDELKKFVK